MIHTNSAADPRDRIWALVLALFAYLHVALLANGIVSSNDGSSFSLVRSLSLGGTAEITGYHVYTHGIDLSQRDGRFYTDRAPFTAFSALPFHLGALGLARAAGAPLLREPIAPPGEFGPGAHFPVDGAEVRGALVPAHLAFALATALLFLGARRFGLGPGAAVLTALLYALGTVAAKYGAGLFTHGVSGALVLAGVLLALEAPRRGFRAGLAAGLVIGTWPGSEYATLALVPVALLVPWLAARPYDLAWRRSALGALVGLLPGALLLGLYNTLHFGAPWLSAHSFNVQFEWTRTPAGAFGGDWGQGLSGLLFGLENRGLLVSTPLLALVPVGLFALGRRRGAAALTLGLVAFGYLLLMAKHRTFWGGGSQDTRYLLPVLPIFALLTGLGAAWLWERAGARPRPLLLGGAALLFVWSAVHQYLTARLFLLDPLAPQALIFGPGWSLVHLRLAQGLVLLPHLVWLGATALLVAGVSAPWAQGRGWPLGRVAALGAAALALGILGTLLVPGALVEPRGLG